MSNTDPITLSIDPAAPNGDRSAMAVMQGNRIHQIFDEMSKGEPSPMGRGKTVTGRSSSFNPPIWQLPRNPCKELEMPTRHNKIYLFRNMEIVYQNDNLRDMSDAHDAGQSGDIALTISYMGKYRMFYWRGKKKHYWRAVSPKKKPKLLAMLKAALLLQQ